MINCLFSNHYITTFFPAFLCSSQSSFIDILIIYHKTYIRISAVWLMIAYICPRNDMWSGPCGACKSRYTLYLRKIKYFYRYTEVKGFIHSDIGEKLSLSLWTTCYNVMNAKFMSFHVILHGLAINPSSNRVYAIYSVETRMVWWWRGMGCVCPVHVVDIENGSGWYMDHNNRQVHNCKLVRSGYFCWMLCQILRKRK